jgi:hypothetical protein
MAQARVSTLGTDQPTRRALEGRQIERPSQVEIGVPMAQLSMFQLPTLTFEPQWCEIHLVVASLALTGRTIHFEGSQG